MTSDELRAVVQTTEDAYTALKAIEDHVATQLGLPLDNVSMHHSTNDGGGVVLCISVPVGYTLSVEQKAWLKGIGINVVDYYIDAYPHEVL